MMNVINPATEQVIAKLDVDNKSTINSKLNSLQNGQKAWSKLTVEDRLRIIEKFGTLVKTNLEELATVLTSETGKPIRQSKGEILGSLNRITHLKKHAVKWLAEESMAEGSTSEKIRYEPLGVVANISAWNFPYNVGYNVFLYALVAGNSVLYKPSEFASLTGLRFKELLHKAGVPNDVFETVIGKGEVGEYMLELNLDGYFFTGSYKTGIHIAKTVTDKLVPVQLELGGKDSLYVMDDVEDLKQVAINAAEGAFYNNGQSCCAVERILVHEKVYDDFLTHFIEEVKFYKIGDPMDIDTFIGPLTRDAQLDVIQKQISQAIAKGAKLVVGGKRLDKAGYFLTPAVLKNVDHTMDVMREESFGPVIGIQKVSNDEEAVMLMKDTDYGLTASVFSKSENRAREVLDQMNVGTVYWNCCDRVSPAVPWSGRKNSGLGSTLSYQGIRVFTQPKSYHLRK